MSIERKSYVIFSICLITFVCLMLLLLPEKENKAIVTLDSKKLINEMILNVAEAKEDKLIFIDEMSQCLSDVVEEYAKEYKVLVLPQQAVIAGGQDITSTIQVKMHKNCTKNG